MTPEQRFDRLEGVAKLLARAGLRAREAVRESVQEQNVKINILIDARIANEGRFAKLTESQMHTDRRLDALIDIIRDRRNGESH